MEKIYLGKSENWGSVYLSKHEFACDWYWAFGYLGNKDCHFHIESMINHPEKYCKEWTDVYHHFSQTWLTQKQWWVIRDLFISAYSLKKTAEVYRYGGHQISDAAPYRIINPEMVKLINADLEKLLDNIWKYLTDARAEWLEKNG